VRPIAVVLIGVSGVLSDIVKGILDEPDIRLSGEFPARRSIVAQVASTHADVVIVAAEDRSMPPTVRELLAERPRTKILTIGDDGRETFLYELRPHQIDLGQISPQALLDAVRTARTVPL
jgi:DNA-binding NarL/FixJ family response regulator